MFEVGRFLESDTDSLYELTELFEGSFRRYTRPGTFETRRRNFADELRRPGSFIARVQGRAVGFGTMERLSPNDAVVVWALTRHSSTSTFIDDI